MIGLGTISALLGLVGLLVPIIIHLLSNRESKELLFGSTRFLEAQESVNPKSLALTDFGQLLLRCGLLALVVVLAALPFWKKNQSSKQIWIEQEIYADPQYKSYLSDLSADSELIPFAIGTLDSTISNYPSLWSVIAGANVEKDSVDIITFNRMRNYIGSTVSVSDKVKIKTVPHLDDGNQTSNAELENAVIRMYVDQSSDPADELVTLLDNISVELGIEIVYGQEDYDWLITTAPRPFPSDKYGLIWNQGSGPLTIRNSTSNTLVLSGEISRTELLESDIPVVIGSRLIESLTNLEQSDNREMTLPYNTVAANVDNSRHVPLSSWWRLVILPLFLWELFVAYKKLAQ